jgi:hypothetical protein
VRELQAQLGINATNSSMPPSANPADAPKPCWLIVMAKRLPTYWRAGERLLIKNSWILGVLP